MRLDYGGSQSRPFITLSNGLGINLFLRATFELEIKKLLIGDIPKVFEIGKVFRNEYIDDLHQPEFTVLETYCAYSTYNEMMQLMEILIREVTRSINSTEKISYQKNEIDLSKP